MKKAISFVGLSLLIFLSIIIPAEAKQKRRNLDYSNPHNVRWATRGLHILPHLVIKIYHNKQYKKDKDLLVYLVHENGDNFISRYNLRLTKERPITVLFPYHFGTSLRGRWDVKIEGFYFLNLLLEEKPIRGIRHGFIYCESSKHKPPPHKHSDKGEPLLPYDKAEFYDFSNMPVNKIKENPDWKIKVKMKYEIEFVFHEYRQKGKKRYKGKGLVKMVIVCPHGKNWISKVNKISKYQCYNFKFPDDFITPGSKTKIENGYHRYYFIVDGVKIENKQNSFIIIHHSDNKSIPTCNIIHFYDCRKLYREFVDKRKEVEKELRR
ncbi:MAG: hypothetical protein K8T10_16275 [Candidatus Eremiobacteraeota bacterium]|nr:hypothetical protein [Candidatus Eremiobacteraeota bacterium]